MAKIIVDIGELGWSQYLRAYYEWMVGKGEEVEVYCLEDRVSFYPKAKALWESGPRECFGIQGKDLTPKYKRIFPSLAHTLRNCFEQGVAWKDERHKMVWKRIPVEKRFQKWITIFPRKRDSFPYSARNLGSRFYKDLAWGLLEKGFWVQTVGIPGGTENLKISHPRFRNGIRKMTIGELLGKIESSLVCVGGQSAPPKIALQQGIPSFMIGHEKARHTKIDNPLKTPAGFYETQDYKIEAGEVLEELFSWMETLNISAQVRSGVKL